MNIAKSIKREALSLLSWRGRKDCSMNAKVYVTLKKGVLDPQGKTVKNALANLGFKGVDDVRIGKYMEVTLNESSREAAQKTVTAMCEKLLANTVIEDYRVEVGS
jgi:phosphoribosylformylglycinamidine synthase PurS subunit